MAELLNWYSEYCEDGYILHGNVKNHPELADGSLINTTHIYSAELEEDEIIAHTKNTEYHLKLAECCTEASFEQDGFCKRYIGRDLTDKIQHAIMV